MYNASLSFAGKRYLHTVRNPLLMNANNYYMYSVYVYTVLNDPIREVRIVYLIILITMA